MDYKITEQEKQRCRKTSVILGVNCVYHESAACLVINGLIQSAVEEERFTRIKHAKEAKIDNPDELPLKSIEYCLRASNLTMQDVDYIGFSFNPEKRLKNKGADNYVIEGDWGSVNGENLFNSRLLLIPEKFRQLGFKGEFVWVDHYMAHAGSAFYPSGFEKAAILTVDGIGEFETLMLSLGNAEGITELQAFKYPDSLGFLWEKMAKFLGYTEYDACKVMSLASFGDPKVYREKFSNIVSKSNDKIFELNSDLLRFRVNDFSRIEELFRIRQNPSHGTIKKEHMDIAAALQEITTEILTALIRRLYDITKVDTLCMAGGVVLNCVANTYIFEQGPFKEVFIQPAAHDAGTALGAALYIWNTKNEQKALKQESVYLGPSYDNDEIEKTLKDGGHLYSRIENIEQAVAKLISEGGIVGWFQGRMEFGPRALGNRSLLADCRIPEMRTKLNCIVKHREDIRPFCPVILTEEVENWFDVKKQTASSAHMLLAYPIKKNLKNKIPSAVHVDGTCRIQALSKENNPRFYNLLSEFYKITGVPIMINTSFNDREPIVCTPGDAVKTFLKTEIDYLAIGNFLVQKPKSNNLYAK